jgi:FMN phosphatase YigB (HAD superfamily)
VITWFVDFDDTLVSGPVTWAWEHVVPRFAAQHQLPYDEASFGRVFFPILERANQNEDAQVLLTDLFRGLRWASELQPAFFEEVSINLHLEPFEDTLPFLERCQARGEAVYVISNNPRSPKTAAKIGLTPYIRGFFTPELCPGCLPKPDRSLWDYVMAQGVVASAAEAVMIGDDPWSDGPFAQRCGLRCWLVDRRERLAYLYGETPYQWVTSLLAIPHLA